MKQPSPDPTPAHGWGDGWGDPCVFQRWRMAHSVLSLGPLKTAPHTKESGRGGHREFFETMLLFGWSSSMGVFTVALQIRVEIRR